MGISSDEKDDREVMAVIEAVYASGLCNKLGVTTAEIAHDVPWARNAQDPRLKNAIRRLADHGKIRCERGRYWVLQ